MIAAEVAIERKPSVGEWLAGDAWFEGLLRDVWSAFRTSYDAAREETGRRLGAPTGAVGPQVKGSG